MEEFSFMASLSHELRNSLNGIVGYSQLLSQTELDSTQKKYLSSLSSCCLQIVSIVNDVLDFSRLTSGKLKVNKGIFSIGELEQQVKTILGIQAKNKKQKLRFVYGENIPEYIVGDKQKIIQVLVNLVSNAIKFTPSGGRILISFGIRGETSLEISVEDNGVGISLENQRKLFVPFFQVNGDKGGSGLGLVICKKLVELMEGDIRVESDESGSTFIFKVNFEDIQKYKNALGNKETLKGKYVLLATRDEDERLTIQEYLFELGINPIMCFSERELVKILEKGKYPFLCHILDSEMIRTGTTGQGPGPQSLPDNILCLVEKGGKSVYKQGVEDILIKPVNQLKLIDVLLRLARSGEVEELGGEVEIPAGPPPTPDSLKILIAEDESYNTEILTKMLAGMKFENVVSAADGEETLKMVDKFQPDILLLDLKMPKLTGIEVAKILKEKGVKIKIAVITASISESDKNLCREYGVSYFLLKPLNMNQFRVMMAKLVKGSGRKG